ncbi:MAG: hypothetical protein H6709_19235 [Kofleriaceae bacterium]|nr:hypothetical protein [Myxococcales bacterium]MCB9574225.1 hypothetical protein [Kofleriaceae bacterium]
MLRARPLPSLAFAASIACLSACVGEGDQTIIILQNQAPTEGCVVAASPSESYIGSGLIDSTSTAGYVFTPVAKNFSTVAESADDRRRIAFVTGARVAVRFANTDRVDATTQSQLASDGVTRFEVPYAAQISPDATTSFAFTIVPPEVLTTIDAVLTDPAERELLLVDVRLIGTLGDGSFESQLFTYPVEVCQGCLAIDQGACAALDPSFEPRTGGYCNPAQDLPVDCCDGICPAVVPPAQ